MSLRESRNNGKSFFINRCVEYSPSPLSLRSEKPGTQLQWWWWKLPLLSALKCGKCAFSLPLSIRAEKFFFPYRCRLLLAVWQFSESNLYLLASVSAIIIMLLCVDLKGKKREASKKLGVFAVWLCVNAGMLIKLDGKLWASSLARHLIDFLLLSFFLFGCCQLSFINDFPPQEAFISTFPSDDFSYFSWSIEQRKIKNRKRQFFRKQKFFSSRSLKNFPEDGWGLTNDPHRDGKRKSDGEKSSQIDRG